MNRLPFQQDAVCPKCLRKPWAIQFHYADGGYIEYRCGCGYEWETLTADAQPQEWAKGELPRTCGQCLLFPGESARCWRSQLLAVCAETIACPHWLQKPDNIGIVLTDPKLFSYLMALTDNERMDWCPDYLEDMKLGYLEIIKRIRASHERLRQLLLLRDAGLGNEDAIKAEIRQIIKEAQ